MREVFDGRVLGRLRVAQNAALQYWQAFAHMPQIPPPGDSGADPDEAKLVQSGKDALLYLHRGAAVKNCDWGLHREDGPYLLLPHLAKGRDLGRLAAMKVRAGSAFKRGMDMEGSGTVVVSVRVSGRCRLRGCTRR